MPTFVRVRRMFEVRLRTALFNPGVFMMRNILIRPGHVRIGSVATVSNNLAIEYKLISQLRKTMKGSCMSGQTLKVSGSG